MWFILDGDHPGSYGLGRLPGCVVAMLFCWMVGMTAAEEPVAVPDAEEVTRILTEWKDSFTNLKMVYEVRNPGQWRIRKPELAKLPNIDDYYRRIEWIYTDEGRGRHTMWYFEAGQLVRKDVAGTDGKVDFRSQFDGNSETPRELTIGWLKTPGNWNYIANEPLDQLYFGWKSGWPHEVFRRAPPLIQGHRNIDGVHCVSIKRNTDDTGFLWLDLEHHCLPRLLEPDPGDQSGVHFHVEEFRPLGNGYWFPAKGTRRMAIEKEQYNWVVTDVAVNLRLPNSTFAPPRAGAETFLQDRTKPSPVRPPQAQQPSQTNSSLSTQREPTQRVTATPSHNPWSWVLGIVSVALVGIGLVLRVDTGQKTWRSTGGCFSGMKA